MGKACFFRNAVRAETVPQFTRPLGSDNEDHQMSYYVLMMAALFDLGAHHKN